MITEPYRKPRRGKVKKVLHENLFCVHGTVMENHKEENKGIPGSKRQKDPRQGPISGLAEWKNFPGMDKILGMLLEVKVGTCLPSTKILENL